MFRVHSKQVLALLPFLQLLLNVLSLSLSPRPPPFFPRICRFAEEWIPKWHPVLHPKRRKVDRNMHVPSEAAAEEEEEDEAEENEYAEV